MSASKQQLKTCLNNEINVCHKHLNTIQEIAINHEQILMWFKNLCEILTRIIREIGNLKEQLKKTIKDTILLYLTQLITSLSLLINTFVREEEINQILKEIRFFIKKQMLHCLEGIRIAVINETILVDPSGNFLKWMDAALEKIKEIDTNLEKEEISEIYLEAKKFFEQVLSHAMSIAQVALQQDFRIIKGTSQSVLEAINSLSNEINKPLQNAAMINLFVDLSNDKLCLLEKRVNTAVLKLCLKIFSEYTKPLELIHEHCFNKKNREKFLELDLLITNFDLHVERIMQIGLFAVSCSSDINHGLKIRNCLASLESLESELVPAFSSVLLNDNLVNTNYASLLKNHWLQQATNLKQFIYSIIEPYAFCQLIYEEIRETVDILSNKLKKNKELLEQNDLEQFLNSSNVLKEFFNATLNEFSKTETEKIQSKLNDFLNVYNEIKSASKLLLIKDKTDFDGCCRVLKRCKVLLTVTKRLLNCLTENEENSMENNSKIPENPPVLNNQFFDHIVIRGKEILKDRSILYKTPIKTCENKNIPVARTTTNLRKLSFINSMIIHETSLDLQITEILNDISFLSNTFNKS